jgi:Leucine-rich repeat (LRR) protein
MEDNLKEEEVFDSEKFFYKITHEKNEENKVTILCLDKKKFVVFQNVFTDFELKINFKNIKDLEKLYQSLESAARSNLLHFNQKTEGDTPYLELEIEIDGKKKIFEMQMQTKTTEDEKIIKDYLSKKDKEIEELKEENNHLKKISNSGSFSSIGIGDNKTYRNRGNDKVIDLRFTGIGNQVLLNLGTVNLDELEELKLLTNRITDINYLRNMKLEKLHILNLNKNFIKDLSPLKEKNLGFLQELHLQNNFIKDIAPLEQVNCPELKALYLDNNLIVNLSPLAKVSFEKLEKLTLHKNKIKDISILTSVPFKNLKKLSLYGNDINDISIFKKEIFTNLKSLWLYRNKFSYENNRNIIINLKNKIIDFL